MHHSHETLPRKSIVRRRSCPPPPRPHPPSLQSPPPPPSPLYTLQHTKCDSLERCRKSDHRGLYASRRHLFKQSHYRRVFSGRGTCFHGGGICDDVGCEPVCPEFCQELEGLPMGGGEGGGGGQGCWSCTTLTRFRGLRRRMHALPYGICMLANPTLALGIGTRALNTRIKTAIVSLTPQTHTPRIQSGLLICPAVRSNISSKLIFARCV